nr:unnamed protein product [Callosobruchus chinensis]
MRTAELFQILVVYFDSIRLIMSCVTAVQSEVQVYRSQPTMNFENLVSDLADLDGDFMGNEDLLKKPINSCQCQLSSPSHALGKDGTTTKFIRFDNLRAVSLLFTREAYERLVQ